MVSVWQARDGFGPRGSSRHTHGAAVEDEPRSAAPHVRAARCGSSVSTSRRVHSAKGFYISRRLRFDPHPPDDAEDVLSELLVVVVDEITRDVAIGKASRNC